MPSPLPIYPSFSLVITQAYLAVRPPPPKKDGLALPSRYHPYARRRKSSEDSDDLLMTTIDYRFSPPPTLPPPPSVSYYPTQPPPLPGDVLVEDEELEGYDDNATSDESHFVAVNNLQSAVHGHPRAADGVRRRPSLSTLVVDLAFHLKQKCQRLVASGSGTRK